MNTYEWYLFGHISGAFLLLAATGATTGSGIALAQASRASTAATLLNMMRLSEYVVRSLGTVLVVGFGALLIEDADHSWGDGWISASLAIIIVAIAIAHGFLMRRLRGSLRLARQLGDAPVSGELETRLKDPVTAGVGFGLDVAFFVVLWLMIAKPGA